MKLKYYLRGLAAGILLTTILLTIANAGNKPLTDAQIRQRALQLGMIDSDSVRLSVLQGTGTTAPESDSPGVSDSSETDGSPSDSNPSDSSPSGGSIPDRTEPDSGSLSDASESETSEDETSDKETSLGATQSSDNADDTKEASMPQEASGEPDAEPVSFQVKSGATSSTVSRELAAAGLIEDSAAFDTFLCNNGYSKRIRAGTYKIVPGTSEEDIAKIITQQS